MEVTHLLALSDDLRIDQFTITASSLTEVTFCYKFILSLFPFCEKVNKKRSKFSCVVEEMRQENSEQNVFKAVMPGDEKARARRRSRC